MKKLFVSILLIDSVSISAYLQTQNKLAEELKENFRTPLDAARSWVYWFWLNSNVTKEGITADLGSDEASWNR